VKRLCDRSTTLGGTVATFPGPIRIPLVEIGDRDDDGGTATGHV